VEKRHQIDLADGLRPLAEELGCSMAQVGAAGSQQSLYVALQWLPGLPCSCRACDVQSRNALPAGTTAQAACSMYLAVVYLCLYPAAGAGVVRQEPTRVERHHWGDQSIAGKQFVWDDLELFGGPQGLAAALGAASACVLASAVKEQHGICAWVCSHAHIKPGAMICPASTSASVSVLHISSLEP
jgi:hypothetical protein